MLFSIIIPTYNRALILRETVLSVLSQSYKDFEIIVVDDGSTDNTKQTIEELNNNQIKYFYKKNEERSIARNYGADNANGEYLIFLDSDDEMGEGHLLSIYCFLKEKEFKPKFIFSGYIILNPDKSLLYEYGLNGICKPNKLFYGNFLGCSSVIINLNLFKKYYFNANPRLILFEDWELWLRVIAENELFCFPNKSIIMINHEGRSVLNYKAEQIKDKIIFFKNHIIETSVIINKSFLHKRIFLMGIYSYAALHIAMTKKNNLIALKYLLLSFTNSPSIIFKRRFFGIIKQLLF